MIVVDSNVVAYLYLTSPQSENAERALLRDAHWAAPLLWRSELRSVLTQYVRKSWLSLDVGRRIMAEAQEVLRDREFEVDSEAVLRLAATSSCSACDCEFVALAHELGVPLVTEDRQVLGAFPEVAISLASFAGEHDPGG